MGDNFARDLAVHISERLPLVSKLLMLVDDVEKDEQLLMLVDEQLKALTEDALNLVSELDG